MWRKVLNIIFMVLAWGAILAYIIYASILTHRHKENLCVKRVEINIPDSTATTYLVNRNFIERQLKKEGFTLVGKRVNEVDFLAIAESIEKNGFVERANIYATLSGDLFIDISQRKPVLRVHTEGYNSYVTSEGYIFRAPKESAYYTAVVTGTFRPIAAPTFNGSTEELYEKILEALYDRIEEIKDKSGDTYTRSREYQRLVKQEARLRRRHRDLCNLTKFVQRITEDSFWGAEVVQYIADTTSMGALSLRLVPRSGNHIILFGELTDTEDKMQRLEKFYKDGLTQLGWERFKTIDIRYDKQVICRE